MRFQSQNLTFGARSHGKGFVTDIRKCLLLPHGRGAQDRPASHHFWWGNGAFGRPFEVWIKLLNLLESQRNWSLKLGWFRLQDVSSYSQPWSSRPTILSRLVQSVIPAEKKKKVCVIEDRRKDGKDEVASLFYVISYFPRHQCLIDNMYSIVRIYRIIIVLGQSE